MEENNIINNELDKGETNVSPSGLHNIYSHIKVSKRTLDFIIVFLILALFAVLIYSLNNRGFTIEFDCQGGTNIEVQKHMYGEKIDNQIPTREGYRFDGWYLDSDCKNKWPDDQEITGSMKLYACWIND